MSVDPMTTGRDWDAIVVGLGGIGSARRLLAQPSPRRSGPRPRAVRARPRQRREPGPQPDHPPLLPPAGLRSPGEAGVRHVGRAGGGGRRPGRHPDRRTRRRPARRRDPARRLRREPHRRGGAVRAARRPEIVRRWPQWRLDDRHHGLFQVDGGLADPNRGNAAHQRLAREHGATLLDRTPVVALRDAGGGDLEVRTADGTTHRAGSVVLAADAWTNGLLAAFGRRLPLTITKEQVTYYACPRPQDFAPDRFPVWIWMDEPCFYGFPTYGEPGPKAAQDVGGRETTPDRRTFGPDPDGARPGRRVPPRLPAWCVRPRPADEDLPLHAHPGSRLRPRPAARGAGRARRAWRSPRLQVRLAHRPDPGRAGR